MEENKHIWNKKATDLTVGESYLLAVVGPIIVIGGIYGAMGIAITVKKGADKIRSARKSHKNNDLIVVK